MSEIGCGEAGWKITCHVRVGETGHSSAGLGRLQPMYARREPTQAPRISELREDGNPAFHLKSDFQMSIGNYIVKFLKL